MKIIEVRLNWFRKEVISKTFLFEDDKSIDIDTNNCVSDMDGFMVAPKSRLKEIENKMNIKIN
tara:strand:+ start:222 stop:410 length:189 start_codon:yes stop_codon:yes gene_type:complete